MGTNQLPNFKLAQLSEPYVIFPEKNLICDVKGAFLVIKNLLLILIKCQFGNKWRWGDN